MGVVSRIELTEEFANGQKPDATVFENLLDSYIHKNDPQTGWLSELASQIDAEQGVINDKVMTPLRTSQAIQAMVRLANLVELSNEVNGLIDTAINALVNSAPGTLDTLGEIAQALGNNEDAYNALLTAINNRYTKAELDAFFEGAASGKKQVNWARITGKPSTFAPSSHNHDGRYYTEDEVTSKLSEKANSSHTHTASQVGLGNLPNAKSDSFTSANSNVLATSKAVQMVRDYAGNWNNLLHKPSGLIEGIRAVFTGNIDTVYNDSSLMNTYRVEFLINGTWENPIPNDRSFLIKTH